MRKRRREWKRETVRKRGREVARQPGVGREGYHNITNHRRRDVSTQTLTPVFELFSRSSLYLPSPPSPPYLISTPLSFTFDSPSGDSHTRYLSSPRAIRTNGRIRQLSRYISETVASSILFQLLLSFLLLYYLLPPSLDPTTSGSTSSFFLMLYHGLRHSMYMIL